MHAKGELQLGILIEEMRREKYEMCVSPPRILTVPCPETGAQLEPIEEVTIDVDQVSKKGSVGVAVVVALPLLFCHRRQERFVAAQLLFFAVYSFAVCFCPLNFPEVGLHPL